MTPPILRPLSVGEILDTSLSLYRRHFGALATVALLCSSLPMVLRVFLEASGGVFTSVTLALLYLLHLLVLVVLTLVATGATVFIVSESYLGRSLSARAALARATPYIGRILVCSMLTAFLMGLGFLLFFFPGVILAVGLVVAIPAVVLEPGRSASAGLSRSWELTRGSRWRLLGLLITLFVLLYLPVVAMVGLLALVLPHPSDAGLASTSVATVIGFALGGLIQLFVYPVLYCVLTLTYYDLRVRKEGFDLELLASSLQPA